MWTSQKISSTYKLIAVISVAALFPALLYSLYPIFGEASNLTTFAAPIVATLMFNLWVGALFVFINAATTAVVFTQLYGMSAAEGLPMGFVVSSVSMVLCVGADRIRRYIELRRSIKAEQNGENTLEAIRRKAAIVFILSAIHPVCLYWLVPIFGEASNVIVLAAPVAATLFFRWPAGVFFLLLNVGVSAVIFSQLHGMDRAEGRLKMVFSMFVACVILFGADRLRRFMEQRKLMLEELAQARKMEAIGRLAGGVAHDMNNTLNAIMSSVYAHKQELEKYGRHFKDLDNIAAACDRGAQLTQNLLGFARKSNYKRQTFSLNGVAEGVEGLLGRTTNKNIQVRTLLTDNNPLIEGDRGQFENAIMNLCLNSLDAMGDQGKLSMTTFGDVDFVAISVSDTGSGMDASVREKVFEPFFTTKAEGKGTGLGLSMVYGVVHAMNGRITLESAPGKGTTITLTFPRAENKEADTGIISVPPDGSSGPDLLNGRTILLIDDEPLVLRAGVRMLRTLGCDVLSARSGQEGIEIFKENKGKISLAIVDLIMPDLDGIGTLESLFEVNEETPILLVSGFTRESEKMETLKKTRGKVRFLAKPYKPEDLLDAARKLLDPASPVEATSNRTSSA